MRIGNLDAPSTYIGNRKLSWVCKEEILYLQACLDQRRHLCPFVISCDGVLGNEAKVVLQHFADSPIPKKHHEDKDEHCNCKSLTSMHLRITHPHYEPNEPTSPVGAGLSLFYHSADNKHISKLNKRFRAENSALKIKCIRRQMEWHD